MEGLDWLRPIKERLGCQMNKNEEVEVYKLVRQVRGRYYSVIHNWIDRYNASNRPWVRYDIGKWTKARRVYADNGYHLLAFKSHKYAKRFANDGMILDVRRQEELKIFKAKARGVKRARIPVMCIIRSVFRKAFVPRWKGRLYGGWPPGTWMCEEIMILEEV